MTITSGNSSPVAPQLTFTNTNIMLLKVILKKEDLTMRKIISFMICLGMFISLFSTTFAEEISKISGNDEIPSMEITKETKEIKISPKSKDMLPKYVKEAMEENPDYKLLGSEVYQYSLSKTEDGKIEKTLVKTFNLKDDKSINEYNLYRQQLELDKAELDNGEIVPMSFNPPRKNTDIFMGLTTFGFSHPTKPTAYHVQGWWEWDESAFGIYTANWDVVGLNFQGETLGYDYNAQANSIFTGAALTLNKLGSDDHGVAYAHTHQSLSEGAVWGKVISSNSNSSERFEVRFIYEYFDANPSPSSYLSQLTSWIIQLFMPVPPVPAANARFVTTQNLYYGNDL